MHLTKAEMAELLEGPSYTTSTRRERKMSNMSYEAMEHIIGPMPLKKFVDHFFRDSDDVGKKQNGTIANRFKEKVRKMKTCTKKEQMYDTFISAMKIACPSSPAHNTHDKPFQTFNDITINPKIAFFSKEHSQKRGGTLKHVEMLAEFKIIDNDDPFAVKPDRGKKRQFWFSNAFETDVKKLSGRSRVTLNQITSYAAAQKAAQFRTHIFSFLLFKKHGRIMFWDCSGIVVTERFSLTNKYFLEFFLQYNDATPEERGLDTTVTTLSDTERRNALASGLFNSNAGLIKMLVGKTEYVVQRYLKMRFDLLFGQSTRGYIAYPLEKLSHSTPVVYIKDTWRIATLEREDKIYNHLNQNQISFIPTMVEAAYIEGQTTICQDIAANAPWRIGVPNSFQKHQHFRLVLMEIGSDLTTFRSTKELVSVFRDVIQAHSDAYGKAGILHRDISAGNILIGPDRRGLLIDWDMSRYRDDRSMGRCGTRPFMAARLLTPTPTPSDELPTVIPVFADDIESFLHTLTWVTLRYTQTEYRASALHAFLTRMYGGKKCGRAHKIDHLTCLDYPSACALYYLPDSPLKDLLFYITEVIGIRYVSWNLRVVFLEQNHPDLHTRYWGYYEKLKIYNTHVCNLNSGSKWIIQKFETILEQGSWPEDDAAKKNPLGRVTLDLSYKLWKAHSQVAQDEWPGKLVFFDMFKTQGNLYAHSDATH